MSKKQGRHGKATHKAGEITRILVGVRLEERLVKVLKGLAELKSQPLGEFLEEDVLAAMEGGNAFGGKTGKLPAETRARIAALKQVYGVDYSREELASKS
jgi:hypothetical protein